MRRIERFPSAIFFAYFCAAEARGDEVNKSEMEIIPFSTQPQDWSGCYRVKSNRCTSPVDGRDCSDQFSDYLKLESSGEGYIVGLYSTQANQNVCSFSFEMKTESSKKLVRDTMHGRISLLNNSRSLLISSEGVDSTALGLGICGVHADVDGLEFPLLSKLRSGAACRIPTEVNELGR